MDNKEIPFGFISKEKIYRHSWGNHPEKEIGEVREGDIEKSSQFFIARFTDLASKVSEVTEKIDSTENKGSFLMKLIHLKDQLPEHDGLGDYQKLHDQLTKYENLVKDIIQKNRLRNSEIKSALIEEAKELDEIINWKEATEKAQDLKTRWIKTGSAEEDKNKGLETDFWEIITRFFDRKKQFYEDKQKLTDHRKRQYEELVEEARKLNDIHGKERFDKVKLLKEKWKETGGIPAEHYKPLLEEFNQTLKKGKKPFPQKSLDYAKIHERLLNVKSDPTSHNKQELDSLKKELMKDRSRSNEKWAALELIQILNERDFILKLANKRFPDFPKMDREKKKGIKKGIINDLIQRDMEELKIYEENSANFSSSDGSMNKLVESKLKSQRKKIAIKSKLLEWIDTEEF